MKRRRSPEDPPRARREARPSIGWREWVSLPQLNIDWVKAKIDSGARSSSLHAFAIEPFEKDATTWVRFSVHPIQRSDEVVVTAEAPVLDQRAVRSSSGHVSMRYVISTMVSWNQHVWPIELTLAWRDSLGFRMLLGREAIRRRFVINPSRSYLGGRPKRV
jgi:hypothetical protein